MSTYTVQPQPAPGACRYAHVGAAPLPDPTCTPGALNPQVTQANISSTICRHGYTASIRPPESVTEPEKVGSARAYGYTGSFATAEYDHLVSLELGGDPNDPSNLWVEPNDRAHARTTLNSKDLLEDRLHELVCKGRFLLARAQLAIATNWVAAYEVFIGPLASGAGPGSTTTAPPATVTTPPAQAALPSPTTRAPSPAPTPTTAPAGQPGVVHPGAFCAPAGASGVTADGTPMTCTTSPTDARNRWRSR
jgi:hypothetical protein